MAGAPPPNFANRTMWTRDNLDVLRGLNSESVDLVYADPPFNSNKNYEAPIGSKAAGAAFKDTWTLSDVDVAWHGEIADREPKVYAAIDGLRGRCEPWYSHTARNRCVKATDGSSFTSEPCPVAAERLRVALPAHAGAPEYSLTYHPSVARPSMPLLVPPSSGLLRRCASTPSSNARLSRSSTPRP